MEVVCDRHHHEEDHEEGRRSQEVEACGGLHHDGVGRMEDHRTRVVVCDRHRREEAHRSQAAEAYGGLPHDEACHREVVCRGEAVCHGAGACHDAAVYHGEVEGGNDRSVEDDGESEAFLGACDFLSVDRRYDSYRALGHGRVASGNEVS